jgi:hypothetical protein
MPETVKAVLGFLFILCFIFSVFSWAVEMPEKQLSWLFRIGWPVFGLFLLGVLVWAQYRRSKVPDILTQRCKKFFEKDGFCFILVPESREGVCLLNVWYENRYERSCESVLVVKPAKGFFLTRQDIQGLVVKVNCGPAGFGVHSVPFPIPLPYQGTRQKFEIGASTYYPQGRGKMVRYRGGMAVGEAENNWKKGFKTVLTVAGLAAGHIVISSPAIFTVQLPANVAAEIPEGFEPEAKELWTLGTGNAEGIQG